MYTRVLVPLDGSKTSEQALRYVGEQTLGFKIPIHLLVVFGAVPSEIVDPDHPSSETRTTIQSRLEAIAYLEGVKASLGDLGTPISCIARNGNPADQIIKEAEENPSTIVAMTTHGRSGVGRWVLGSVTDKVLLGTTGPLLLVRAEEETGYSKETGYSSEPTFKHVIVPLDGSSLAEQILPHVVSLARSRMLNVVLVRATPSAEEYHRYMNHQMVSAVATGYSGPYEEFARGADAEAVQYLHDVKGRLIPQGVLSVEERLVRGNPAGAILDLIDEIPDSLVALTTHGRSGVGRWVMGSVADRLVRNSGKPVLVVRAKA